MRVVACYRNAVIYRQVGHFSTRPVFIRVLTFSVEGSGPSSQIFGARRFILTKQTCLCVVWASEFPVSFGCCWRFVLSTNRQFMREILRRLSHPQGYFDATHLIIATIRLYFICIHNKFIFGYHTNPTLPYWTGRISSDDGDA